MAAPMRDPPLDGGHRAKVADARAAARSDQANNFEYDDNEWDLGITDLIIDLDADIEKTREAPGGGMASAAGPGKAAAKMGADHSATLDKGLKMKIKRTKPGGKASEAKHEIVKSGEADGASDEAAAALPAGAAAPPRRASGAHRRDKATRDKQPSQAPSPQHPQQHPQHPQQPQPEQLNGAAGSPAPPAAAALPPAPPLDAAEASAAAPPQSSSPPPPKKIKIESKDTMDMCVGTSVATITEPDCLGPCEPGTSVTLEGIVWHETEGGVLVVNVTWRGKTYVGTLLDCTRHDWAPPRFCDSPTEELDARTPKGRGKRGRAAAPGDLSNFTETRSSVHSKLRNGGAKGRRGGASGVPSGSTSREVPSPPPPSRSESVSSPVANSSNKRKARAPEEDSPASKRRTPASPPASPALLECPEPNCSKKYKHINGLKYHQSHAHGAMDDDEVKDIASMSENDESNMEAPSPIGPVKSPEKIQEPGTPKKDERQDASTPAPVARPPSPPPPPAPVPTTPAVPATPPVILPAAAPPIISTPVPETKPALVKPGVLRFGPQEDFPVTSFINKPAGPTPPVALATSPPVATPVVAARPPEPVIPQFTPQSTQSRQTPPPPPLQHSHTVLSQLPLSNHVQHPSQPNPQINAALPQNIGPPNHQKGPPPSPQNSQFKVKPTAALMPPLDDKKLQDNRLLSKPQQPIKKTKNNRKSPAGSPLPPEQISFGIEMTGRDEVTSPAYSDISDDTAPPLESDSDKAKMLGDKKQDGPPLTHAMPPGYMYPFYGQAPYLVPSVQTQPTDQIKQREDPNKILDGKNLSDKDKRDGHPDNLASQKLLPQHYYSYSYMAHGYPYNMDPGYAPVSMVPEDKLKEHDRERDRERERDRDRVKESPSPAEHSNGKPPSTQQQQQQPLVIPGKSKQQDMSKDSKHPNENHQILKESIEMKSQMSPYMYQRHQAQQQQQAQQQRTDEMHRYYIYTEQQRRKENNALNMENAAGKGSLVQQSPISNKSQSNQNISSKPPSIKDVKLNDEGSKLSSKEDIKPIKQEGQKPTMETTGPPPAPTSGYYVHPSYMGTPHYGGIPFDPMYRGMNSMLVSGPYGSGPYLHPSPMPRYHAPEDLSRPPPPTKALDLLQHHSQYYSSHKIHELQERALKSPTPKAPGPGGSPGGSTIGSSNSAPGPLATPPAKSGAPPPTTPTDSVSGKEARSPPPQRHVHTHHHTHVGLGYPIYPASYGAAVLASQQASAVTVINSFPPK